jgi:hypothetical protein
MTPTSVGNHRRPLAHPRKLHRLGVRRRPGGGRGDGARGRDPWPARAGTGGTRGPSIDARGGVEFDRSGERALASAVARVGDRAFVGRDGETERRDPRCGRSDRQEGKRGYGGAPSVHGTRSGRCDGGRLPRCVGRGRAFSRRASGGVLSGAGAAGDELGGKAATTLQWWPAASSHLSACGV